MIPITNIISVNHSINFVDPENGVHTQNRKNICERIFLGMEYAITITYIILSNTYLKKCMIKIKKLMLFSKSLIKCIRWIILIKSVLLYIV